MITYIEAQMGIYLKEKVILIYRAFEPSLKIRAAPKNKFKLCGAHLHQHAKRRSY